MQLCKCHLTKLVLVPSNGVPASLALILLFQLLPEVCISSLYIDTALSTTHASPLCVFFTCRSAEYLLVQVKMHCSNLSNDFPSDFL